MKLVVGLGNPGRQYEGTRHNVGFDVVDYLAAAPGVDGFRSRFRAEVAEANEAGTRLLLAKPQTYMNLSGESVRQIVDFFKMDLEDILVICDDINLPLGKLRARAKGTHGGQNGLRNIQDHLGTTEYARLRIGVDAPRGDASGHVLSKFRAVEVPAVEGAVAEAARAVLVWAADGVEACANRVNGGDIDKESQKKSKKA